MKLTDEDIYVLGYFGTLTLSSRQQLTSALSAEEQGS
jgi:hypothetical protein